MLNDACAILRSHGINAYEQGDEVAVYAVTTTRWSEVARYRVPEYLMLRRDPQAVADWLVGLLFSLVRETPHSHDTLAVLA